MVAAPNQNFVEQGQIPHGQLLPGRRAEPDERVELRRPHRLQRVGEGSLLLPRVGHDVPRAARRLDVRIADADVPRSARQRQDALLVGVHRQLDASDLGCDRVRHADLDESLLRRSAAPRACISTRPPSVGLPSYLDEFCSAVEQVHDAGYQLSTDTRASRTPPTAASTPRTSRGRATSRASRGLTRCAAASTMRLAMRRNELDRRRQRLVDLYLRQHLHARGGHDRRVPGQQHRPEPRGPHARHSDARCRSARTRRSRCATRTTARSSRTRGASRRTSR